MNDTTAVDRAELTRRALAHLNRDDTASHQDASGIIAAIDALTAATLATARPATVGRPAPRSLSSFPRVGDLSGEILDQQRQQMADRIEAARQRSLLTWEAAVKDTMGLLTAGLDMRVNVIAAQYGKDTEWADQIVEEATRRVYDTDERFHQTVSLTALLLNSDADTSNLTGQHIAQKHGLATTWGEAVLGVAREKAAEYNADWSDSYRDDVRAPLTVRGWTEIDTGALVKNGATWCETSDRKDSDVTAPEQKYSIRFDSDVPAAVVVAACESIATGDDAAPFVPAQPEGNSDQGGERA